MEGRWLSPCGPVSSANQTDRYNITEILLNVTLNNNNHITNDIFIISLSPEFCHIRGVHWFNAKLLYKKNSLY